MTGKQTYQTIWMSADIVVATPGLGNPRQR